jgi:outer membrane protein assembly factor BamB
MPPFTTLLISLLLGLTTLHCAAAENWPCWRGPRGDGTSNDTKIPNNWDVATGKNILWKIPVPGNGHASPILWNDRVFLATCFEEERDRALVCLDAATGNELWRTVVLNSPLETVHKFNSYASATPATDGELVYTAFLKVDGNTVPAPNVSEPREITPGRIVLTAIDFDGDIRWQVDVGDFVSAHGFCSCPVLYQNLVIINGDHDGDGYLVAVDKTTGQEVWRASREHGIRSYVTPIIRTINGQDQLVLSGSAHVASFNPHDGKMIWKVEGPTEQFVASMVFDGERFIMAAGFPTHHVMAIRPDGTGDVTQTHIAWHVDSYVRCYVPSPVLIGQQLFVADDRGTANCFDSTDGTRIWQGRLAGSINASLVATDRNIYFLSGDGVTKVVAPGPELNVIAENKLDEACHASPAISNGRIYIRGDEHLFCIGNTSEHATAASQ